MESHPGSRAVRPPTGATRGPRAPRSPRPCSGASPQRSAGGTPRPCLPSLAIVRVACLRASVPWPRTRVAALGLALLAAVSQAEVLGLRTVATRIAARDVAPERFQVAAVHLCDEAAPEKGYAQRSWPQIDVILSLTVSRAHVSPAVCFAQ